MYENAINLYNNPSNKLWSSIHNFLDCQVISPLIHFFIIKPFVYNERAWSHLSYINRHDNEYFLSRVHIITTPKFSRACDGLLATPRRTRRKNLILPFCHHFFLSASPCGVSKFYSWMWWWFRPKRNDPISLCPLFTAYLATTHYYVSKPN